MTRMIKSAILSICLRLSVENVFKKYQTRFEMFTNILPGCYLLDTVYDSVS